MISDDKRVIYYHCLPEPKGPPANSLKIGIIIAARTSDFTYMASEESLSAIIIVHKEQ